MARNFDGAADYATQPGILKQYTWTISAWVQPDVQNTGAAQYIVYNGTPASNGWGIYLPSNSLTPNGLFGGVAVLTGTIAIPLNKWSHVLLSKNTAGTDFYLFVNGVQSVTSTNNPITPTGNLNIGAATAPDQFLDGKIAEVAVWTEYLSGQEYFSLWAGENPLNIRRGGLKEYLPFRDYERRSAIDGRTVPTIVGTMPWSEHPPVRRLPRPSRAKVPVAATFQAAWARNANTVLGTGIRA